MRRSRPALPDPDAEADALAARKSSVAGIDHPTMIVGLINGGINTNVVPDHVTFRIDRRIIPEEKPAEVEAVLTRKIHDFAAKWPAVQVSVKPVQGETNTGNNSAEYPVIFSLE